MDKRAKQMREERLEGWKRRRNKDEIAEKEFKKDKRFFQKNVDNILNNKIGTMEEEKKEVKKIIEIILLKLLENRKEMNAIEMRSDFRKEGLYKTLKELRDLERKANEFIYIKIPKELSLKDEEDLSLSNLALLIEEVNVC